MKKVFYSVVFTIIFSFSANAQSVNPGVRYQHGYVKKNGTYVKPHFKTNSNSTNRDNFSTRSNVNPFTGSVGTRARDYSNRSYNYGSGRTIYAGSRGGQYYYNGSGSKVYVPKRR